MYDAAIYHMDTAGRAAVFYLLLAHYTQIFHDTLITTQINLIIFQITKINHQFTSELTYRHKGPRFNVSSERLLIIFSWPAGDSNPQPVDIRNTVFTSPTLYLLI